MTSRLSGGVLTLDVPMEPLTPGPVGRLIRVVDYHPPSDTWFTPVDLDEPAIIHQDGLRPTESDPRSHQQIVYAVGSSVLERFERFLGRRFRWSRDERLTLYPHAFEGRNAYFDPSKKAVLFGYFRADEVDPGPNLPGQTIFTCLSLDIVAHEVTHALVHRLRRHYTQRTNPDVLAFHEAFADLVALFHHFVFPEVVRDAVASSRGDLTSAEGLFDLATEFGRSTGRNGALRSALAAMGTPPDGTTGTTGPTTNYRSAVEPHERGNIFVCAVFDAFISSYRRSISDLLRIATGGTGVLPEGHLHPDLVKRVAAEAVATADRYLGLVIRSFDYLPVVDPTFGDVVRSIVTADRDLYPDDQIRIRSTLVESFRKQGIYPDDVASLADDTVTWPRPPTPLRLSDEVVVLLGWLVAQAAQEFDPAGETPPLTDPDPEEDADEGDSEEPADPGGALAMALFRWARTSAADLGLDPHPDAGPLRLAGRHVSFRRAQDRQPQPEVVIQLTQRRRDLEQPGDSGIVPDSQHVRAGTTIVVTMTGEVRYVIAKPLPRLVPADAVSAQHQAFHAAGERRLERVRSALDDADDIDISAAWADSKGAADTFRLLHLDLDAEDR